MDHHSYYLWEVCMVPVVVRYFEHFVVVKIVAVVLAVVVGTCY